MKLKEKTVFIALLIMSMLALAPTIYSRLRVTKISMPESSAWSDGFEVLVSKRGKVIPMHLAQAMNSLKRGGSFLLDESDKDGIVESIVSNRKKLYGYDDSTAYPFVDVDIVALSSSEQRITYSVHYSARTYEYSYVANSSAVTPRYYSISDIGSKQVTNYQ